MSILTFVNIISCLSLLIYPFVLVAGVMSLGGAGLERNFYSLAYGILSITYPLFVVWIYFLSRRLDSIWLALLGTIPTLFLFWTLVMSDYIRDQLEGKKFFQSAERHFICSEDEFISVGKNASEVLPRAEVQWVRKHFGILYSKDDIGYVFNRKWFIPSSRNSEKIAALTTVIKRCRNFEGNTITDLYKLKTKIEDIQKVHQDFQRNK